MNALLKTVVDAEERKFVRQELVTKKLPWNEAKLAFIEHFGIVGNLLSPIKELMKLKQDKETVEVFKQKFTKRVRETLLREDTPRRRRPTGAEV